MRTNQPKIKYIAVHEARLITLPYLFREPSDGISVRGFSRFWVLTDFIPIIMKNVIAFKSREGLSVSDCIHSELFTSSTILSRPSGSMFLSI